MPSKVVFQFLQAPQLGMPLFCYKDKILEVGIEVKMKGNDVKTFYNIGSEKNWILSVMEDNEIKGKMNVCLLTKHYLTLTVFDNSKQFHTN